MKILMHICCANCAIYPVKVLREHGHQVTGFFFNPNIHPYQEYRRRLDAVKSYAAQTELPMIYRDDYALEEFLTQVAGQPADRCSYCYRSRLDETARLASAGGYDAFTSSLLYSRRQKHEMIRELAQALAALHQIDFYYQDFRIGWQEGIDTSRSMGLYRQNYCGCIYSEKERFLGKPRN